MHFIVVVCNPSIPLLLFDLCTLTVYIASSHDLPKLGVTLLKTQMPKGGIVAVSGKLKNGYQNTLYLTFATLYSIP